MIVMSISLRTNACVGKQLTGLRCQVLHIAKTMVRMALRKCSNSGHGVTDRLPLLVTQ